MDLMISAVNEADLGWKADVCKYQKHHPKYGAHCDKEAKLILAQLGDDDLEMSGDVDADGESLAEKKPFGKDGDKEFEKALG